jgi:TolA-binding protein
MVCHMSRWVVWFLFLSLALARSNALAQPEAARAAADREAAEERYRRLNSAVEDLMASQADLRRQLGQMAGELQRVSVEARSKPSENVFVTREEFNKLLEKVREVDAKREADKKQILEEIDNLGKSLKGVIQEAARRSAAPAPAPEPVRPAPAEPSDGGTDAVPQEGVYYVIEKGNTLTAVIAAHNEDFKKKGYRTTLKLVLDANPKIKPTALAVGQKIFIPMEKLSR